MYCEPVFHSGFITMCTSKTVNMTLLLTATICVLLYKEQWDMTSILEYIQYGYKLHATKGKLSDLYT